MSLIISTVEHILDQQAMNDIKRRAHVDYPISEDQATALGKVLDAVPKSERFDGYGQTAFTDLPDDQYVFAVGSPPTE